MSNNQMVNLLFLDPKSFLRLATRQLRASLCQWKKPLGFLRRQLASKRQIVVEMIGVELL